MKTESKLEKIINNLLDLIYFGSAITLGVGLCHFFPITMWWFGSGCLVAFILTLIWMNIQIVRWSLNIGIKHLDLAQIIILVSLLIFDILTYFGTTMWLTITH